MNHHHFLMRQASAALRAARLRGQIIRPEACCRCGAKGTPEGHIADYSKPLAVAWLCHNCRLKQLDLEQRTASTPSSSAERQVG